MFPRRSRLVKTFPIICCCLLIRIFIIREGRTKEEFLEKATSKEQDLHTPVRNDIHESSSAFQLIRRDEKVSEKTVGENGSKKGRESPIGQHLKAARDSIPERYRNSASDASTVPDGKKENSERNESLVQDHARPPRSLTKPSPLWMRITDSLYAYSAFWDPRQDLVEGPVVRILGIVKYGKELLEDFAKYKWSGTVKEGALNCSCHLWYRGQQQSKVGLLRGFIFEEGLKDFVGTFFLCYPKLSKDSGATSNSSNTVSSEKDKAIGIPYAVSLVPEGSVNSTHRLIYIRNRETNLVESSVSVNSSAVCVRPLFGPFTDLKGMTQFIAYYKTVLDVTYFYFYDLAIDAKVKELLSSFSSENVVIRILPWNVPTSAWDKLWDSGSLTALNDCVYRASGHHRYVTVVDLDEFIVPRLPAAGLGDVYHNILKHKRGQQGDAALVNNAFFCPEFKENAKTKEDSFPIFQFTQREARLWPATSRSKMIVVPETIVSIGHHMVHNFLLKTFKNQASLKMVSVLHHYRACVDLRLGMHGTGSLVLTQETVKDATMMKYKKPILGSIFVAAYKNFTMQNS